jgi:predicted GTPase
VNVLAFTAAQIPGIDGRRYPAELAGPYYPEGIPIVPEESLEAICAGHRVEEVVFAYSDVPHAMVMHVASRALACGADFRLLGPERTMLPSERPVIAVSAVRTGCGKSQIARWLGARLRARGLRVAVLRHPMPYGDLGRQRVQRFATAADLDAAQCTNEEREEYEPHIAAGGVVFAGVDYEAILRAAEREADVIVWDGGNNDFPFLRPGLHIVVADALRPTHVDTHHPGETTLRMADVVVIAKCDAAPAADVARLVDAVRRLAPKATVVRASSPVRLADPAAVRGKRVLVVDDGPTLTHGGMAYGAGLVAAKAAEPLEIVDPRESATAPMLALYAKYPHLGLVLPAVGYDAAEREAFAETVRRSRADVVVSGSPFDLAARVSLGKPVVRAYYDYADAGTGEPTLGSLVDAFLASRGGARGGR